MPGRHTTAVPFVDPAGQLYPSAHGPLQFALVAPVTLPYRPASHGPLQLATPKPVVDPYVPRAHTMQLAAPASEYCPAGQLLQAPSPRNTATVPAAHGAQTTLPPVLLVPKSHSVHDICPVALVKLPAGHVVHDVALLAL